MLKTKIKLGAVYVSVFTVGIFLLIMIRALEERFNMPIFFLFACGYFGFNVVSVANWVVKRNENKIWDKV